jgi:hypothetical protein
LSIITTNFEFLAVLSKSHKKLSLNIQRKNPPYAPFGDGKNKETENEINGKTKEECEKRKRPNRRDVYAREVGKIYIIGQFGKIR